MNYLTLIWNDINKIQYIFLRGSTMILHLFRDDLNLRSIGWRESTRLIELHFIVNLGLQASNTWHVS